MIQHIIAIAIVFLAIGYTLYSVFGSLFAKESSACSACSGCNFKKLPLHKPDCDKALP